MALPPAVRTILLAPNYVRRWGVVEHWSLDEASGVGLASINSANNLTDNNTVTSAAGKVNALARQFTAANSESLLLADNAALSTGDVDFWVAAWVYFDALVSNRTIVSKFKFTGSNDREYLLDWDTTVGGLRFLVSNDGTASVQVGATTFGALSTGAWYFCAAYHDAVSDLIGISVNGGAFDTAAHTTGVFNGAADFNIGARNQGAGNLFDGRIGPVTFGKSPPLGIAALATEIRDRLYNGGAGRAFPWR